jgi:hypothetical protein
MELEEALSHVRDIVSGYYYENEDDLSSGDDYDWDYGFDYLSYADLPRPALQSYFDHGYIGDRLYVSASQLGLQVAHQEKIRLNRLCLGYAVSEILPVLLLGRYVLYEPLSIASGPFS